MREFIILGYSASSSSSIATLPNPHGSNHSTKPYKDRPLSLPKLSPSKSSPPISTVHSRPPPLFAVRWDPTKTHLSYFADLASKLARDGKFQDFAMVVESVVLSGVRGSEFTAALKVELVAKGISRLLKEGNVRSVVEVLGKVNELGVPPLKLFDGYAMELLGRQCSQLLKCKQVQELVELMEVLAGFHFPIKELLEPSEVIKLCVDKCCPKLAIRYACIFPHAHILFCNIIYEFGKRKALEPALAAYEASKENLNGSNMYVYRTIIDVCGLCKDYMKSRYIYEDLLKQKVTPNIYVFNSLMNVNAHDLNYTFHVYKSMQNLGIKADMACYNILLKACCLAGRVDLAQDIYREVQHLESTGVLKLDVFTYSTIVKVFADAKLWHMALNVKEDMLSAGVTPKTVTWSSLISACANAGIVEKAIQLFEEMLLAGSEPNSQCFNILLHACVEANQYDRAFRLFQSLKSTKVQETFGKKYKGLSFKPTTTTYNTLMKACGTDYYHAKALLDEMRAVGLYPNQISWSILADICGGSGNVEGALQILKNMRAAGMKPDVVAYTTAIKVCVENENLELALSLFAEMKKYQIHPNLVTYNTLLRARSRYGSVSEVQQCLAIYQDMRKAGYKSNDYYLEQLIEEWCEGVIQDSNAKQEEFSSCNKTDIGRPGSLLLEKVAEHLQTHIAETLAVDLQGLTKVEAQIVVLAVLRMIKENYTLGHSVKDDMLIVVGEVDGGSTTQNLEVKDAITKLLQDELGLKVLAAGAKVGLDTTIEPGNSTEDGRQRRLVLTSDSMPEHSDVFLIDHAWTFRLSDAYKQLMEVPGLAERMAAIMCVDADLNSDSEEDRLSEGNAKRSVLEVLENEITEANGNVRWLELEDLDIDDETLSSLDLSTKCPGLFALSFCGNKLEHVGVVVREVTKFKNLRALWLNNNPVVQNCGDELADKVLREFPNLEIYNSKFTSNYGEWALGFCGGVYDKENPGSVDQPDNTLKQVTDLDLSNRCIHNLFNKAFTPLQLPCLSYLNLRGNPLEETAVGDLLQLLRNFPSLQSLEVDIPGPLGESAVQILESLPNLSVLNGVNASKIFETEKDVVDSVLQPRLPEWTADEPLTDRVINAMWLYLMTYRLADEEKIDETSVLYVMDELGSALRHSDEPNFRVAPFLFMPEGTLASAVSFSILWPIQNVQKGYECTRDYLFGIGEDKQRSARLTAWFNTPENYFIREYEKHQRSLKSKNLTSLTLNSCPTRSLHRSEIRVYTDIPQVEELLTHPEFVITTDPKDAEIIWTCTQVDEDMKKATGITDNQYINQFPFEACIVMKHHLAETIQKAHGSPEWQQPTYNLETHLSQLIGDYCVRKRDGLNNLWILKPWNMARTIDTTVTGNISAIIRLMETGPKICQKYIEHPALFQGKKFDIRYIVFVRSMNPLEIFLSDTFWVRLANNQYSLDQHSLFEYETHFTVMNYRGTLNHKNTSEFVREFEQEHQVNWLDIHSRVKKMIRSVFEAAAQVHPEMHSTTSRAMYGVDVMLDSSFQPKLLEVTYCPDCGRACKYDMEAIVGDKEVVRGRDFYNYVFGCLFLNETTHVSPL